MLFPSSKHFNIWASLAMILSLLALSFGSCVGPQNLPQELNGGATVERLETPTQVPPTQVPPTQVPPTQVPQLCPVAVTEYLDDVSPLIDEYADSVVLADSTPGEILTDVIFEMQRIRREFRSTRAPECARGAAESIVRGMDGAFGGYLDVMAGAHRPGAMRKVEEGVLDINNGLAQLQALASGGPTPAPRELPTLTPTSTPRPSPTAVPPGASVIDGDWEITVDRVEIAQTVEDPIFGDVFIAKGRFAIVYFTATNKGLEPKGYTGLFLSMQDSSGRTYEHLGHGPMMAVAGLSSDWFDRGPEYLIAVFDIPTGGGPYYLVRASLWSAGVREEWRLQLDIP